MKLFKKKTAIIGIFAILGICIIGIGVKNNTNKTEKTAKKPVVSQSSIAVKVQPVQTLSKATTLSYSASLDDSKEGIASSKMNGKVIQIYVEDGSTVAQGAPLVKLDDTDLQSTLRTTEAQLAVTKTQLKSAQNQLAAAQAGLQKQQTSLETAQQTYDQTKSLYDVGAVSKTELDTAANALKSANTDLTTANLNIETLKIAVETAQQNINSVNVSIGNAKEALTNTIIRAPIAGVVDDKAVDIGQYVTAGTVLAKIKDITTLNAVIQVKQSDIGQLKKGMQAQIKLSNSDSKTYAGTLQSIPVSADETSRTFACKVSIPNSNRTLHPGDFVIATLISDQKKEGLYVPVKALSGSDGNYSVFIVSNGAAKKTSVTIGETSDDIVEIQSGVEKGQSVIVTNLNTLQDGDAVTVFKEGD